MYRAIIAVVIVAAVGLGGYLLYRQYGEPAPVAVSADTPGTDPARTAPSDAVVSPPVDVDALLARLPEGAKGSYVGKSYDAGTGVTTIEGLELTFTLPDPPSPPPPPVPPPGGPQDVPPGDQNGSLAPGHKLGAVGDRITRVNLAPPDIQDPQDQPFGPTSPLAPPFTDPLNPFSGLPQDFPAVQIKTLKLSIGRATLSGLDVDAFEAVFDPSRYTAARDENFRRLFHTVTLTDVKLFADGKEVGTIGSVDGRGLFMKQFAFVPGGADFDKQFKSEEAMGFQIIGMTLDAVKLDALAVTDFKIYSNEPNGRFSYGWANYTMSTIDRGRFGPARSDSLTFEFHDPVSNVGIAGSQESQHSEGADFTGVLPYMIKGEMPPVSATNLMSFAAGRAKNLKYVMPGYGEYVISEMANKPVAFEWLIPSQIKFNAKGSFKAGANPDPETANLLRQLGQTEFPFDMTFAWKYEGVTGNAQLDTFALNMAGLYGIDFGIGLSGMKLSEFATEAQTEKMMGELLFSGLRLIITDQGGTRKAIKIFADESELSEDQAREFLKQQALGMAAASPDDPAAAAIANAFAAFIQNPGKLSLTAMPAQPVPFLILMMQSEDPATLAQTLNIKVEATAP